VIDAGTDDGVRDGMAVVDEAGVLGRVLQAEASRSTVLPYLNTEFRVAAKIQPLQALGIVRWPGERNDRLIMDHVVKTEPVEKGQVVVTSGMSGVFPEGYPIGVVDSVRGTPGQNNLEIFIRPTTLLSRAEFAFVVVNTEKP
jgi:rod shape-determining protein MreC